LSNLKIGWRIKYSVMTSEDCAEWDLHPSLREQPLHTNQAWLVMLNQKACAFKLQVPFPSAQSLREDNGERFMFEAFEQGIERRKLYPNTSSYNDRCPCRSCTLNPVRLPHESPTMLATNAAPVIVPIEHSTALKTSGTTSSNLAGYTKAPIRIIARQQQEIAPPCWQGYQWQFGNGIAFPAGISAHNPIVLVPQFKKPQIAGPCCTAYGEWMAKKLFGNIKRGRAPHCASCAVRLRCQQKRKSTEALHKNNR